MCVCLYKLYVHSPLISPSLYKQLRQGSACCRPGSVSSLPRRCDMDFMTSWPSQLVNAEWKTHVTGFQSMQHNFKFGTSGSSDPPKVLPSNTRLQRDHSSPLSLGSTTAAGGQGCQVAKWGPVIATVLLASNSQTPEKKQLESWRCCSPAL